MASLHYLTVQDVLWINLQITKKVHHFNYARLEEATYYQYAYGESNTLFPQAERFVSGFARMHPFDAGNEATAFVACLAFLSVNGYATAASDERLSAWFKLALGGAVDAIKEIVEPDAAAHHGGSPDVRGAIRCILAKHASVVGALSGVAAA
ncbi:MAG TPA: Fic family protein [Fimbriimonadaceae bacterium]|nr:Fic family protein [Fimbriimonadaceae bacterium]